MTAQAKAISKTRRIHWMDNLRSIIIFLVVLYHIGGVYESTGMWASFWIVKRMFASPSLPAISILDGHAGSLSGF